jgi:hypothetical protein
MLWLDINYEAKAPGTDKIGIGFHYMDEWDLVIHMFICITNCHRDEWSLSLRDDTFDQVDSLNRYV